jgi:hypothetical protein
VQVGVTLVIHADMQKLNDQADEMLEVEILGQCKVDPLIAVPDKAGDVYCHAEAHEPYPSVRCEVEGREFDRAVFAAALATSRPTFITSSIPDQVRIAVLMGRMRKKTVRFD